MSRNEDNNCDIATDASYPVTSGTSGGTSKSSGHSGNSHSSGKTSSYRPRPRFLQVLEEAPEAQEPALVELGEVLEAVLVELEERVVGWVLFPFNRHSSASIETN